MYSGLHIVEQSLWKAVPHYLRRVSNALKKVCKLSLIYLWMRLHISPSLSLFYLCYQHTGRPLPLSCTPIKFGSWMGGDRDGNPNVTSKVIPKICAAFQNLLSLVLKNCFSILIHFARQRNLLIFGFQKGCSSYNATVVSSMILCYLGM